ncbi:MAG: BREX system serine/threonine kinase PglW [Pseudonocardia sp.]|nr:BREX system serine/threonine kinase PglW [Pseudonocardia sp.]
MKADDPRWEEITPSQFTHEAEGLRLVRELLPSAPPYRAWSNFEFRDGQGRWHEVDLLLLGRGRLHLVELKYYRGLLGGDDHRWVRDHRQAEDSPLKLARRKAQRLASLLQDALRSWLRENPGVTVPDARRVVPFVQESVFLHHPDLRCVLPAASRRDLFGLEGHEQASGLPSITARVLEPPEREAIGDNRSEIIAALLKRCGIVQRRQREAGSWVIDEEPLGEGDGWQEWPAFHKVTSTTRGRIRFSLTPPGTSVEEQVRTRRRAEREYAVLSRLAHDAILRPLDLVEAELGVGLVYPADDAQRRLDLWLAEQGEVSLARQVDVLRQVAEAVGYAHRHRVVHRGLLPQSVWVREGSDGRPRAVVGDWRSAGGVAADVSGSGLSGLGSSSGSDSAARLAALAGGRGDAEGRLIGAFQAPEGVWQRDADRIRLDVFALGALAFYLFTGYPPASDRSALRERLRAQDGLDLAADLPQVPSPLRTLVLEATRPQVASRLADVASFLALLEGAENALLGIDTDAATDPLEARAGTVLDSRFRVDRRLGAGSTAVGMLVTDFADDSSRVLKIALDDAAAARLSEEAEVLRGLDHPRLVSLLDGPLTVGTRTALLLRHAGDQTLGDVLGERRRQSIDLLERWGTDLLDAVVELDRIGVVHRDIKPANLGVAEWRRDRAKHLVLFDFSLARAGATATTAGTPPYLDPFLDSPGRRRYDSAAERYAAAVVLFEMGTGAVPVFGDGMSDPSVIGVEATVEPDLFDPALAPALVTFFRRALHSDSGRRFDTAGDMRDAWATVFSPVSRPSDPKSGGAPDRRAQAASVTTPLNESGLSARALSAVEPLRVATVGELLAIDRVRLNRLPGVAEATRKEITEQARAWRDRLGAAEQLASPEWSGPRDAAAVLHDAAGSRSATARRRAAAALLGLDGDLYAFATQAELAAALGVTTPRGNQLIDQLQVAWSERTEARDLLDAVGRLVTDALEALGGVATVAELAGEVLAALGPGGNDGPSPDRLAAGLVRVALDRVEKLRHADPDVEPLARRRRGGRLALIATRPELLDLADQLVSRAEGLLERRDVDQPLVTGAVAQRALATDADGALVGDRLVALAAAHSSRLAVSGRGELYHLDLPIHLAVRYALGEIADSQQWAPHEVRARIKARFPALSPLPSDRAGLDAVLAASDLPMRYDPTVDAYRSTTRLGETGGLETRAPTPLGPVPLNPVVDGGHAASRLADSVRSRSFLALGVEARRFSTATRHLASVHGATVVDVTRVLVEAMRAQADEVGLPWETVRAADAATAGSRDAAGLAALVARALGAIDAAVSEATAVGGPVLLTELAPLARYGHLATLARWTDLALRREQAIWALVGQMPGNIGPVVDGKPLPLSAPGQFVRLDAEWFATVHDREGARA